MRNFALVQFLSDVHALEIGIDPVKVEALRKHRDGMARLIAKIKRKSGLQIAKILLEVSTHKDYRAFEIIVQDALEYLGFFVDRMALSGQPEGIAKAYPTPSFANVREIYSFSFDAKSSKYGKVETGNVNVAGLARHRRDHTADHALVVAPDFEGGALEKECAENCVTPMRAEDMSTLLLYTAQFGAIPLTKLRQVFKSTSPDAVAEWVKDLRIWLQQQRRLTFDLFIKALRKVEQDIPDALAAAVLARECRRLATSEVTKFDILTLARGLQIMVPDLIRVDKEDIVISAHLNKLVDAVASQLNIVKDTVEGRI